MEENATETIQTPSPKEKDERPEVIIVRNWKEYLGESLLIIFSVTLALVLTEIFNKIHEDKQAREILHELREELISNKESEEIQYQYHLQVLRNIDSALNNPTFAQQFLDNGEIHLRTVAPQGILRRDLIDFSWQIAKQNNVFVKMDLHTYSLLTDIYANQQKISKVEDKIGRVLLSLESRKPENGFNTDERQLSCLGNRPHTGIIGKI